MSLKIELAKAKKELSAHIARKGTVDKGEAAWQDFIDGGGRPEASRSHGLSGLAGPAAREAGP